MEIIYSYVLTAFFTSSMGSLVRMVHDNDVIKITLSKGILIYICSLATGYMCYELAALYEKSWIVGIPSLILALGAVEITGVFKNLLGWVFEKLIKALPNILIEAGRRMLNLPPENKEAEK